MISQTLLGLGKKKYANVVNPVVKTKYPTIGTTVPKMRLLCKEEVKMNPKWMNNFEPKYFEQVYCYGLCIAYSKLPNKEKFKLYKKYFGYCDSWSHIDSMVCTIKPKESELPELWKFTEEISQSENQYARRMAIVLCLTKFMSDKYIKRVVNLLQTISCGEYYVNIALAWAYAEMLCHYPEIGMEIIKSKKLPKWIQNKAIQKAIESFRVSNNIKKQVVKYRIKNSTL